jgi:hypothetical protein
MTLPDERYRAVLYAEEFLRAIADPNITKRIPKEIRQRARGVLRHYPNTWDMQRAAEASPDIFAERMEDVSRMFKKYEQSKENKNA